MLAERHPVVKGVRGRGLMLGLELVDPGTGRPATERCLRLVNEALRRGWIVLPDGAEANILSLTPPLSIGERLLERATEALGELLD
jgi:4-aminobutyrate aminotransferase-like enzyme